MTGQTAEVSQWPMVNDDVGEAGGDDGTAAAYIANPCGAYEVDLRGG
ncbi:hypothetical protein [Pseudomonas abietaniphila]